jgi:hypothetical protein
MAVCQDCGINYDGERCRECRNKKDRARRATARAAKRPKRGCSAERPPDSDDENPSAAPPRTYEALANFVAALGPCDKSKYSCYGAVDIKHFAPIAMPMKTRAKKVAEILEEIMGVKWMCVDRSRA